MAKNYYDITLALAGICQSARLVQQLAHQGHCDADALHVSLNSVIDLNPARPWACSAAVKPIFVSVLKLCWACLTPAAVRD